MTYSEAIRMGGVLSTHLVRGKARERGGTCANAGALDAVGKDDFVDRIWPWAGQKNAVCPVCKTGPPNSVVWLVANHLNDLHLWTRDQIADWVASQERKLAPAPDGAVLVRGEAETDMEMATRLR